MILPNFVGRGWDMKLAFTKEVMKTIFLAIHRTKKILVEEDLSVVFFLQTLLETVFLLSQKKTKKESSKRYKVKCIQRYRCIRSFTAAPQIPRQIAYYHSWQPWQLIMIRSKRSQLYVRISAFSTYLWIAKNPCKRIRQVKYTTSNKSTEKWELR